MNNKTYAIASQVTRNLHNENVVVVTQAMLDTISLVNAKTGKTIYTFSVECVERYGLTNILFTAKQEPSYPAPKVRKPRMTVKTHGAPKYVGISMGSFKPEANLNF